jgi:hypothetical protein
MVLEPVMAASKSLRRLKGETRLPMRLAGVTVADGAPSPRRIIGPRHPESAAIPLVCPASIRGSAGPA